MLQNKEHTWRAETARARAATDAPSLLQAAIAAQQHQQRQQRHHHHHQQHHHQHHHTAGMPPLTAALLLLALALSPAAAGAPPAACTFKAQQDWDTGHEDQDHAGGTSAQICCQLCQDYKPGAEGPCVAVVWDMSQYCWFKFQGDMKLPKVLTGKKSMGCLLCDNVWEPGRRLETGSCPVVDGGDLFGSWGIGVLVYGGCAVALYGILGIGYSVNVKKINGHPHSAFWRGVPGLASDGVAFAFSRTRGGGGGYEPVAAAAAPGFPGPPAAGGKARFEAGEACEYQSSKGWIAAEVTRDAGGAKLDLNVKKGARRSKVRALPVGGEGKAAARAAAKAEQEAAAAEAYNAKAREARSKFVGPAAAQLRGGGVVQAAVRGGGGVSGSGSNGKGKGKGKTGGSKRSGGGRAAM